MPRADYDTTPAGPRIGRRSVLAAAAASLAASTVAAGAPPATKADAEKAADDRPIRRGQIRQSVCHWCFNPLILDELARSAASMGFQSVELVSPSDWPTLKRHGLVCAISPSHGFAKGFADPCDV